MNLQQIVMKLIKTDDSYSRSDEDRIKSYYNNMSQLEKNKVDYIFISLCGHGLDEMLSMNYVGVFEGEVEESEE